MPTSSITKEFVVTDEAAFQRLLQELEAQPAPHRQMAESPALNKGGEKLAAFVFREEPELR